MNNLRKYEQCTITKIGQCVQCAHGFSVNKSVSHSLYIQPYAYLKKKTKYNCILVKAHSKYVCTIVKKFKSLPPYCFLWGTRFF